MSSNESETCDISTTLQELAGDLGKIVPMYGGYEIEVLEAGNFPWHEVFEKLISCHMTISVIWLESKNILAIISKYTGN